MINRVLTALAFIIGWWVAAHWTPLGKLDAVGCATRHMNCGEWPAQ